MSFDFNPATASLADAAEEAEAISRHYESVRAQTDRLAAPLSPEDCCVQSMTDASPTKWHLAHTTWFFEQFVLDRYVPGYVPVHPRFTYLFNSYYNAVGERQPRAQRGLISRPSMDEVRAYRREVDRRVRKLIDGRGGSIEPELARLILTGLSHEQQHQELLLTDIKHLLSCNTLRPAYRNHARPRLPAPTDLGWTTIRSGLNEIGHEGSSFAFDNETPRHRVHHEPYQLADRLVTCGEYQQFMDDGGYSKSALWLDEGWCAVQELQWEAPLYWFHHDGGWRHFTLEGAQEIDLNEPVTHVSFFEADAFARWAGVRLATEQEWEIIAAQHRIEGNFVDSERLHPAPATGDGMRQLFGDVWEWTGSQYRPYPGYREPEGALGEYNGKFMSSQFVLRGGSCATPRSQIRHTYRNFFHPTARWQFSGIRLARSIRK